MTEPYNVVGLIPTIWGANKREDIFKNIEHQAKLMKAATWLANMDLPVKLIVLPEGALQGFNDEIFDLDHVEYANSCAIDIPGPETDALGALARQYGVYIMAQAKARHPDIKDRFFNVGFIIDDEGNVILQHYKIVTLLPVEHSVTPHDIYDWWIEKYGRTLDAFWPVVETPYGRMGIMMASEGVYPENARGLAMNGCEVVYRASSPHPIVSNDQFEIQNRARALDNTMYVLAPNVGTYYLDDKEDTPIDTFGGNSMIVNHRGQIVGKQRYGGVSTWVSGTVDIAAMRHHRANSQWTNSMKDLKTEIYRLPYEEPIYPKNLYLNREPMKHDEYNKKVTKRQIDLLHERDIWKKPD
ncbi:MAG: beta-ureidopropionase [Planctomycetota bacterium]|jgi:beta-ureidopropionase